MTQTAADDADLSARYHALMAHCRAYNGPDTPRSLRIVLLNFFLFFTLLVLMYAALAVSYALVFLLAVPAAFILVRLFIVQHDCGHGSYFKSRAANDWTGRAISLFTFAPYGFWRREHDVHHAFVGQIERQDIGYIDILTREGYLALPPLRRALYRLYRHPLVLLLVGVPLHNIVFLRIPPLRPRGFEGRRFISFAGAWRSVLLHNAGLFTLYGGTAYLLGGGVVFALYAPIIIMAWQIGGWMFYVHHHFEDAYWQGGEEWHPHAARLFASSQYRLPPLWHWLTGYIGLHHVHHFSSGIPHYKLAECMAGSADLQNMNPVSFRESLSGVWLAAIDPARQKMIRLSDITG
ncbi:MAG: fatty acid desaturase [Alphaproteobacteria bacterium]|nr:fatty acid desaturase [Alphaproteobacteria bacterium]